MRRRCATVATPGEWQCKTNGVRRLAVANGPNIFQMLLVYYLFETACISLVYDCICLFLLVFLLIVYLQAKGDWRDGRMPYLAAGH